MTLKKYLYLLKEMGIFLKVEESSYKGRYKIGKFSIYQDKLDGKLKEIYDQAKTCQQMIQRISYNAHRMGFDVDFNSWADKQG